MKKITAALAITALAFGLSACTPAAQKVSENISTAADNFEVQRKIVGINTRNMEYVFYVEGRCSIERQTDLLVTCKHGDNDYRKHYLGLPQGASDVVWVSTQLKGIDASVYKTRIILKPEGIIPEVELSTGVQ